MKVPREAAEGGGSFGGSEDGSAFINGALIGISENRQLYMWETLFLIQWGRMPGPDVGAEPR